MRNNYTFSSLFDESKEKEEALEEGTTRNELSLRDALRLVRGVIEENLGGLEFWVRAELSNCKESPVGHLYLDLVERDGEHIVANVRANAWSATGQAVKRKFEKETGSVLRAGIKVLLLCGVAFSEHYGLSFRVTDIDPNYTLGDLERRRREIIEMLTRDGVIDLNKRLSFPERPRCVAVVSSGMAAGYEDFENQTRENAYGVVIQSHLYSAQMQGEQTARSVVEALRRIYRDKEEKGVPYDAVVIIRGGGSTADLSWFDNYELASEVAQFPLPIIVGIGHTRDNGVLDAVANRSVKTPTECGEMLVRQLATSLKVIEENEQRMREAWTSFMNRKGQELEGVAQGLRLQTAGRVERRLERVETLRMEAMRVAENKIGNERLKAYALASALMRCQHEKQEKSVVQLETMRHGLARATDRFRMSQEGLIRLMEERVKVLNPLEMLARGYALVTKEGKRVASMTSISEGDKIVLRFTDGKASARVEEVQNDEAAGGD